MTDEGADAEDGLEFDDATDTYSVEFDVDEETPSTTVVTAIAAIVGRKQEDLEPLFYSIDPEALDALFNPATTARRDGDLEVSFTYQGFTVAVRSYGIVEIRSTASPDPS